MELWVSHLPSEAGGGGGGTCQIQGLTCYAALLAQESGIDFTARRRSRILAAGSICA